MHRDVLAGGPQGAREGIAGPGWTLEVARSQPDAFRLEEDAVDAALDVERSPPRALPPFVRHDRIGGRPARAIPAGGLERVSCGGQPLLEVVERRIGIHRGRCVRLERRDRLVETLELVLERARVILDARELHPHPGEVGCGLFADRGELLEPPRELVAGQLELLGPGPVGHRRMGDLPVLGGPAEEHEQHEERPHRAEEHGEEREERDGGRGADVAAAHAAFPVRCGAASSTRRGSDAASPARAASSCTAAASMPSVSSNRPVEASAARLVSSFRSRSVTSRVA
ncbi:MAG: hypothetical protein EBS51_14365, partial [Planctomycetia bacterium]|nr:hypothetical protein [Planctomycetia bacterium]